MADERDIWEAVTQSVSGAPFALRIHLGGKVLKTVRVEPDVTYIGRMPENHIVLNDAKISRSHARVIKMGKQYVVQDQHSENGIFVHGKRVQEYPLGLGEMVVIGDHTLEVVEARNADQLIQREAQLEQAEDEEWRMDKTISLNPGQVTQMIAQARLEPKKPKKAEPPTLALKLTVGNRTIQKEIVFSHGRPRKEGEPEGNAVEIRLSLGKWVLYKKEPL